METYEGRELMWKLICSTGFLTSPMTDNSELTAFNVGRQSVGTQMYRNILGNNLEELMDMHREEYERQKIAKDRLEHKSRRKPK